MKDKHLIVSEEIHRDVHIFKRKYDLGTVNDALRFLINYYEKREDESDN